MTQLAQLRQTMASVYDTLTYLDAADPTFPIKGRLAKEWTFTEPTKFDMMLQKASSSMAARTSPPTTSNRRSTTSRIRTRSRQTRPSLSQVDSVEVLDPLTVRLNLNRPWAAMPADLSTIQIYAKTATKDSIQTTPNGTGPFMWTEWVPGDHITLTKNPNYWHP